MCVDWRNEKEEDFPGSLLVALGGKYEICSMEITILRVVRALFLAEFSRFFNGALSLNNFIE